MNLYTRFVSSLEKVFCEPEITADPIEKITVLRGETGAFQLALNTPKGSVAEWEIETEGLPEIQIREAAVVPCLMPAVHEDPFILRSTAGLYPNPLMPTGNRLRLTPGNWHALWISIAVPEDWKTGVYPIKFKLRNASNPIWPGEDYESEQIFQIEILSPVLPKQKLKFINWFYADCLASQYNIPCWTEAYWKLLESYFRNMTDHGINLLLTPLWSVPLDTAVGTERPTAQLLEISEKDGIYEFDFSRLKRWIDTAKKAGFELFEMSHAFTQWGACFTPKIIVKVNGKEEKRFGWHVAADSEEYRNFLEQLFPRLLAFLKQENLEGKCYFHVSDEPTEKHLESYGYASNLLKRLLEGKYAVLDALSSVQFYRKGLVPVPVPCTPEIDDFMKEDIKERWVYYCGNWEHGLPNRQFGMPSARNRIFGVLLYIYNLDGFLNWGYNFWYTQCSANTRIDPFKVTDAGRAFRGAGSFMVYPGEDGPIDSIHYEVFREALQDLRALQFLESRIGRDAVLKLIQMDVSAPLTMRCYPRSARWLLSMRDRINRKLTENP